MKLKKGKEIKKPEENEGNCGRVERAM